MQPTELTIVSPENNLTNGRNFWCHMLFMMLRCAQKDIARVPIVSIIFRERFPEGSMNNSEFLSLLENGAVAFTEKEYKRLSRYVCEQFGLLDDGHLRTCLKKACPRGIVYSSETELKRRTLGFICKAVDEYFRTENNAH